MSGTEFGIFARCFPVQSPAGLAESIAAAGFSLAQLNLSAAGSPTIPNEASLAAIDFAGIARDFQDRGVGIWGLSASYNMAHPDPGHAATRTENAARLIRRAPELGVTAVTLCTGSRNPDDMWAPHPDNASEAAWSEMMLHLAPLLDAADDADVLLAIEPEPGNVISGTAAALRLVEELGERASRIGFILDPANLVAGQPPEKFDSVLREAFDKLGEAAICVHAKDVIPWRDRVAGGSGLDFGRVRELHAALRHRVPIILQDADPVDIPAIRELIGAGS